MTAAGRSRARLAAEAVVIDRLLDCALSYYVSIGASPTTFSKVRGIFRTLRELGVRNVGDVDDDAVRRFDAVLRSTGARNRDGRYALLRRICKLGVGDGLLGSMPYFRAVRSPRDQPKDGRIKASSRDELMRTWHYLKFRSEDTWKGGRLFVLFATLQQAGTRRRETLRLRKADVVLDESTMWIRPRKGPPVPVPISDRLKSILAWWLPRTGCDWVFPGDRLKGPWTGAKGSDPLNQIRAAAPAACGAEMSFESIRLFFEENSERVPQRKGTGVSPRGVPPPGPGRGRTTRPSDRARVLTIEEATQLMVLLLMRSSSWEGHRLFGEMAMVQFAGLKRVALYALRCGHVKLAESMLCIPGFSPVFLSPVALEALTGWLERPDRGGSDFVFPGITLKGPWLGGTRPHNVDYQLSQAAKDAGIEGVVTMGTLRRLWLACEGRVELGKAWRTAERPAPILTGPPPPSPVGPKPTGRSPRKKPRKVLSECAVRISEDPREHVWVWAHDMGRLTTKHHFLVKFMHDAGREGRSPSEMAAAAKRLGIGGWEQILGAMRRFESVWRKAIEPPGEAYRGARWKLSYSPTEPIGLVSSEQSS